MLSADLMQSNDWFTGGSGAQNFPFLDSPIIALQYLYSFIFWSTLVNILESYSNWESLGRKKSEHFPYNSHQDITKSL